MQLCLQVPEQLTGKSQQQLEALAFEALVVRLYALGELSSGEGAKLLGLTRREFLDLLGQYNVSLFDDEIDLKKETVVVTIEDSKPGEQRHVIDILTALPGHQLFHSAEEVDAYIREEHDSWER